MNESVRSLAFAALLLALLLGGCGPARRGAAAQGRDAWAARSPSPPRTGAGSATAISPASTGSSISASPSAPTSARPTWRCSAPALRRFEAARSRARRRGCSRSSSASIRPATRPRCCAASPTPSTRASSASPAARRRSPRSPGATASSTSAASRTPDGRLQCRSPAPGGALRAGRRADRDPAAARAERLQGAEAVAADLERWVR